MSNRVQAWQRKDLKLLDIPLGLKTPRKWIQVKVRKCMLRKH